MSSWKRKKWLLACTSCVSPSNNNNNTDKCPSLIPTHTEYKNSTSAPEKAEPTNQLSASQCSLLLDLAVQKTFTCRASTVRPAPVVCARNEDCDVIDNFQKRNSIASTASFTTSSPTSLTEPLLTSSLTSLTEPLLTSSSASSPTSLIESFSSENHSSSSVEDYNHSCETMFSRVERSPQFTLKPQSCVAVEDTSVEFRCCVTGTPRPIVTWYKGSTKLVRTDRISISSPTLEESNLHVIKLRATDGGSYRCVAHNSAGQASCSVELVLAAKQAEESIMAADRRPYFSEFLSPHDVRSGERVKFECRVEGKPKPTVVWNKDGKVVSPSSRVRVMEVYGSHSLVISRTEHTDRGVYSITASNHVGSETCSAQLHVQDMSTSRGSSTSYLTGSNRSSPATSNLSSPALSPKLARAATSRLVSGNASPWSSNLKSVGSTGAPPRRRGPGFILRPRPQTIAPGERLCLKCTLLGHPKPTVTWEKDGELVDEERTDGRIRTTNDGNDYYLQIDDCDVMDAGKYGVTARNSLGKQTAAVDVVVSGSAGQSNNVSKSASKPTKPSHPTHPTNNNNDNNNISRQEEPLGGTRLNHKSRAMELILPSHKREEETKESPTSSISSTVSSQSRISTSSSRSNASAHQEDTDRPIRSSWKRSNFVAPTFVRRLSSTQVLEGEELLLQCEVEGEPEPDLYWLRNGRDVGAEEDEVFTSYRNGVARLRLRDVQVKQAGEYVCKARNDAGVVQCSSRVTVKAKPVHIRPRFTKSPEDARVTEGDILVLEAEVEGNPPPEVVWSLDGEEVSHGESTFVNGVAKLTIRNIDSSSSGQYMCNALNLGGEDSVACRVRVKQKKREIPPEFTAPLSDVKSKDGDDVCLRCMVTGIPEPTVQWMFNNEILEPEEGLEITFHEGVAALMLEQATDDDTGTYTCVAVNCEGECTTSCRVVVTATPKVEKKASSAPKFTSTFDEYIRAQDGDKLVLECTVTGHPEPEITWSINDQSVPNTTSSFKNQQASLVIEPITSAHSGHIKCTAHNGTGKVSHEARIYVRSKRVAPSFEKQLPQEVVVEEGKEACFECEVRGHPQPRVTWTRDGRSLSVLSTETSYEDGKASVRIRKAGTRDGGRYVCTARNLSGEAESVCGVKVVTKMDEPLTKPPKFTSELKDVSLEDGQDLHLSCHVTGTPTPEVSWKVDGQRLEPEDGEVGFKAGVATLVLDDVMKEDTGRYECVATNEAGSASSGCNVTVQAPKKTIEPAEPAEPAKPAEPAETPATPVKSSKPVGKEPSFPLLLEDLTVEEGDDIVLRCKVVGMPRPKITWLLDGEAILDADLKYEEDGSAQLVLSEALPEDEGVYTCIAENPLKRVMCSCKVTIAAIAQTSKKVGKPPLDSAVTTRVVEEDSVASPSVETNPSFVKKLEDRVIPDGSSNVTLSCVVEGSPDARWMIEDELIEDGEDFRYISDGNIRGLLISEVFPEDSGVYSCVISNGTGESRCSCKISVEEIEGETPTFLMKPKPVSVNAGERAFFSCRVDGDPPPSIQWLFCNQPIIGSDRITITEADPSNNHTHSLEIPQVSPQDAGRYAVCCRNLLGDVTCTVSLIVSDAKKLEIRKDFRDVLKKSPAVKTNTGKPQTDEQMDFRGLLRRASTDKELGKRTTSTSGSEDAGDDTGTAYKEALSTSVKTKAMTEEERKRRKAEQLDFRANLVRKVDTKVALQDRTKTPEQQDFREEALKTRVRTKALGQDDLKYMSPEQKDFRGEAIKSKVVTKAYKEELIKTKRAEQVDFRDVLSPTRKAELDKKEESISIAELPRGKWRKDGTDHTTVATKRSRHKGAAVVVPVRRVEENGRESEEEKEEGKEEREEKPQFTKFMDDVEASDGQPFTLECTVTGEPRPEITWYLDEEEVKAEADISITYEGDICRLSIAESFPDDQGKYSCTARNIRGEATCSAFVTVVADGESA